MDGGHLLDNRYRLGPVVGRGGMATVYAATDTRLDRPVAVKLFHPGADEITLARLEAEARLLAQLSHPGLLRVFDACTAAGRPYLITELISGCTLRTVINRGPVAPNSVARMGARLAETLRYIHSRQVVHRDLKPSNVLLDRSGRCYLADFGIAKALDSARLTGSGNCVGTAAYLAPEQVAGDGVGPPADIYALGLVLLECATGRPEYTGTEVEAAVARLRRSPRVPDWLPPPLRRVLLAMTARDPRDRPDAAACAALLDGCVTDPSAATVPVLAPVADPHVPDPTKVAPVEPTPPPGRRRAAGAVSAVALAAGIALTMLLWTDSAAPGQPSGPATPTPGPNVGAPVDVVPQTAQEQVVVSPPAEPERPPARAEEKKGAGKKAAEAADDDERRGGDRKDKEDEDDDG